ncbi:hypothetical protein EWM64_g2920 [Hericium alpestre]|uniref:DUF7025 domain-containing protein n=1 Tax=Hericium alpestre TaxID=135208 RepID=A0A4Z0A452_9AGAM|nr:hypothetical protein EWM64_g2920 [Hericium alpestre]
MLMAYDDTTPSIARVKALSDLEAGEGANNPPAESNEPVLDLEFKRVKQQWNEARQKYDDRIELEETFTSASDAGYAFSLVRMLKPNTHIPYVQIHVRSRDFITAAQDVMAGKRNVVWQTIPVKFEALELLAFLPQFVKDLEKRQSKPIEEGPNIEEHNRVIYHLEYFVNFLQHEYSSHVETFNSLRASTYIIFDSLWALLLPGMTLMTKCKVTGVPRLVRLITMSKRQARWDSPEQWALLVEYVDMVCGRVGLIEEELIQDKFSGAKPIVELVAYPFEEPLGDEKPLVEDYKDVKATLVERGRKRSKLEEESYMWYDGDGFYKDGDNYRKHPVQSRIVIDRDMYDQHSGHSTPNLTHDLDHEKICPESRTTLSDDEYALIAPRVYGFALEKKQWYQFSVNDIYNINWDLELFGDLNLDEEYKTLLKVMVGACYPEMEDTEGIISSARFDDFLWGKGKGFICNLHGPPGVGKSLTIEALSEVTKN